MNFYIGNALNEINIKEKNVEVNDDFIQFIYNSKNKLEFDVNVLCEIDPYNDVQISIDNLNKLICVCNSLLKSTILESYDDQDGAKTTLEEIVEICLEALEKGVGLVSIGD